MWFLIVLALLVSFAAALTSRYGRKFLLIMTAVVFGFGLFVHELGVWSYARDDAMRNAQLKQPAPGQDPWEAISLPCNPQRCPND